MVIHKHSVAAIALATLFISYSLQASEQIPTAKTTPLKALSKLQPDLMMKDLNNLQAIAQKNKNNRAIASSGGRASAEFISSELKKSKFTATRMSFKDREGQNGQSIIAELKGKNTQEVILIGAHYDSVATGLGINDNGSGVALLLNLAKNLAAAKVVPNKTIRLAFWDGEETGIAGSTAYVQSLSAERLTQIKAYINLDMVGTKKPQILVADTDKSSVDALEKLVKPEDQDQDFKDLIQGLRELPIHPDSRYLETTLRSYFAKKGYKVRDELSVLTASDTAPFLGKVPTITFTAFNERVLAGGELEFAPCYHKACDTVKQVSSSTLGLFAGALLDLLKKVDAKE